MTLLAAHCDPAEIMAATDPSVPACLDCADTGEVSDGFCGCPAGGVLYDELTRTEDKTEWPT